MKKLFGSVFLMAFLISACGAKATATPVPPTEPPPTQSPFIPATVVPPTAVPSTQTPINPSGCTDSASFVEDVTVPDHTNFNQGDVIHKVWRVKNTGTCAWNGQYALVFSSGDEMSAHSSTPLSATKPGDTLDIALDLVAPSEDGSYRGDFEIDNPSGAAMPIDQAKTLWVAITVGGATTSPTSSGASTSVPAGSTATSSSGAGGPGLVTSTCAFTTDVSRVNDVITAINAYRAQNNLHPYNVNTQLTLAAQSHSEDMACNNLFVHTGSNGSTPTSRVAAAGYSASSVSENVYGSFPPLTGQGAVSWWATDQTDPQHNLNLISTQYEHIGVGYAYFNHYGYYVVDFVSP
jgi:uncharacterized protein YkwD